MRILKVLVVLLLPLALLGACGDDDADVVGATTTTEAGDTGTTEEPAGGLVLGMQDNGTEVGVDLDSSFDIAVEQCIGCGYEWRVLTAPDDAVLTLAGESDTEGPQSTGDEPVVGGMNEHVFHFEVVGRGRTTIELGYFPPAADQPEDTYFLMVEAG